LQIIHRKMPDPHSGTTAFKMRLCLVADLPPQNTLTQKFTILLKLTKEELLNEKVKIYRTANCYRAS
jgi:hypothetical protein